MNTLVVGAGPAGVSTAAWLTSLHVPYTWVAEQVGGMLAHVWSPVDNFPPHKYANGTLVAHQLARFADELGAPQLMPVDRIDSRDGVFVALNREWDHVVLATGTRPRPWTVAGSAAVAPLIRRSSSKAPDEFAGQRVAVLGGGDGAFEAALRLAEHSEVHIFVRADVRARPVYVEAVAGHRAIHVHRGDFPRHVEATAHGARLTTGGGSYEVAAIYPKLGFEAALPVFGFDVALIGGCLEVQDDGQTSVRRLYGVGDVTARPLRGIVTAMSDGARAARSIADAYESMTESTR